MKVPWYWLFALALMIGSALVLTAIQTSLWFFLFGHFPSPMFWLVVLVYASVTRPLWEATLITYLLSAAISPFTVFPLSGLLIYNLLIMLFLMLIRERVFWGGPTYFMLMVAGTSLAAPVLFWLVSHWIDKNPLMIPNVLDWLIAGLQTTLFSLPLYRLYQRFDVIASLDSRGGEGTQVGPR